MSPPGSGMDPVDEIQRANALRSLVQEGQGQADSVEGGASAPAATTDRAVNTKEEEGENREN